MMCGWPAWVMLLCGIVGFCLAVLGLVLSGYEKPRASVIVSGLAVLVCFTAIGLGPIGTMMGRAATDRALAGEAVDPSMKDQIRQAGYAEADACKDVGVGLGTAPLIVALGAFVLAIVLFRKKS